MRSETAAFKWSEDTIAQTPRDSLAKTPDVITVDDASAGECAPLAKIAKAKVKKRKLKLSGKTIKCAKTGTAIRSVEVSLYKKAGAKCRFVKGGASLGKPTACGSPVALVAKGKNKWSLKLTKKLPKGTYGAVVRAIDKNGLRQAAGKPLTIKIGG